MYKLQLCNTYTQEVLREEIYEKPDRIHRFIDMVIRGNNTGLDSYLFDDQRRTSIAEYVTHTMIHERNQTVYKVFFKVRLSEIQAKFVEK